MGEKEAHDDERFAPTLANGGKRWTIGYGKGSGPKALHDKLTVAVLRSVRVNEPDAYRDLLRMLKEASR